MTHRWRNYKTKLILHKLTLHIDTYLFLFSFFTFRIQSYIKSCIRHCSPKWGGGRPFISLRTYLKSIKLKLKFIFIKVFISIQSYIQRVFHFDSNRQKKVPNRNIEHLLFRWTVLVFLREIWAKVKNYLGLSHQ